MNDTTNTSPLSRDRAPLPKPTLDELGGVGVPALAVHAPVAVAQALSHAAHPIKRLHQLSLFNIYLGSESVRNLPPSPPWH